VLLTNAGEGFLAVARMIDLQSRIGQRFAHCGRQRLFILHQQHVGAAHGFHRRRRLPR
jgi:hypothetical protein